VPSRSFHWVLGLVLTLSVVLLNLPPVAAGRLRVAVSSLFLPLFGLAGSSQSIIDRAAYASLTRNTLIGEIERLRQTNQQLQLADMQGRAALDENVRLRSLLGWQPQARWTLKAARVVGRDPTTWWRTITLDFGERHGARVGQPVLTSDGLVGRIREVYPMTSQVVLVGDNECGVSTVIRETRDQGLIQATAADPIGEGVVLLRTLQHSPGILAGHSVVTSGLGGVFPPGIPVGQVLDTRPAEGGLYTEARVRLAARFNRLEEVWILTRQQP